MKNNKIRNILNVFKNRRLISAYILSFVFAFMLYFYEPLTMYLNNINDFWFNLGVIIMPIIKISLLLFLFLVIAFTVVYYINKKISKKLLIFDICLISFFVLFVCTYIQGNFLANNLPPLDGTVIDWYGKTYLSQNVISIVLWVVVSLLTIIITIKTKRDKIIKYIGYIPVVIFAMLMVSLVSVILTNNEANKNKETIIISSDNIENASSDKNFFIFVIDATDSVTFEEVMNNSEEYKNLFDDFTYFKDTMSVYPFTRDSIPLLLSGIVNENKTDFGTYSTNALNNSKLFKKLEEEKFSINLYDSGLVWNDKKTLSVDNIISYNKNILYEDIYYKEQTKYILFKYLPFPLKKFSNINRLNFYRASKDLYYYPENIKNYKRITENKVNKINSKYFQFLHINGAHVPFDLDENLNQIEDGTYEQKIGAMLKITEAYLNKLKENNVYDNSVIIIMADHGYAGGAVAGRQNPILFIKGIDEHHEMINSNIPVSQVDLIDAYIDLIDGEKSTDLFKNIDSNRERRFLFYEYTKEDHMIECVQTGKAWDEDTLVPTGKEFNR